MKTAGYIGGLLGLGLLIASVLHTDLPGMLHIVASAGWPLLGLVPYRALYFLSYARGWQVLLHAYQPQGRFGLNYIFWVTAVREAIDRLLPVASVGGGVVGVRLMRWRGLPASVGGATVIVEIVLTLIVSYAFTALGLILLLAVSADHVQYRRFMLTFLISLPVPILTVLLLRHGSIFARLQKFLGPLVGQGSLSEGAAALDRELRACLGRRRALVTAGGLQFAALLSGSAEVWFALRLFGHPVTVATALILESMTQAMRHLAFVVPAGLGVQETTLIVFGQALGIDHEMALAVSTAKRVREVLCGIPALLSWQWMEARRLRRVVRDSVR